MCGDSTRNQSYLLRYGFTLIGRLMSIFTTLIVFVCFNDVIFFLELISHMAAVIYLIFFAGSSFSLQWTHETLQFFYFHLDGCKSYLLCCYCKEKQCPWGTQFHFIFYQYFSFIVLAVRLDRVIWLYGSIKQKVKKREVFENLASASFTGTL